jgi:hypothetical protein
MGGTWGNFVQTVIVFSLFFCAPAAAADLPVPGLAEEDFRQIGEQGFGDPGNSYAWAMAYFKGKLYVGTNRYFLCVTGLGAGGANPELPRNCAPNLIDMDLRGRIYEYDPATNQITEVYVSPTFSALLSDGTRVDAPHAAGFRTMTVFTEPDGTEALYVGSFATPALPSIGARILRSVDGREFTEVPLNFPNGRRYSSFRSLTVYKNRLYALGHSGDPDVPDLIESADPFNKGFRTVNVPGYGDPANSGAFELEVFAGYLYVGTFAATDGFQLLKTQAVGEPPYVFQKVLVNGAYRGSKSQSVVSLKGFHGHLYVGSGVYFGSSNLIPDFKPAPAELLRVAADDSWELICGEERQTPDGFKTPLSGRPAGFGNGFTNYMWRMTEHDGVLYLGTFDTSVFAQYASNSDLQGLVSKANLEQFPNLAPLLGQVDPAEIADMISAVEGGFDLWKTQDGVDWRLVSRTGFGDSFSYGVRNLQSTPFGLFLGTANPFYGCRLFLGQPTGTDTDGDSFPDLKDNCPLAWNLNQADTDGDGIGDACDTNAAGGGGGAVAQTDNTGPGVTSGDGTPAGAGGGTSGSPYDQKGDNGAPSSPPRVIPRTCGVGGVLLVWAGWVGLLAMRLHQRSGGRGPRCRRANPVGGG